MEVIKKEKKFFTPILLIAFNRPDTTRIVFSSIKKIKPRKLYVSFDGPREGKESDIENCKKTKHILEEVDWDCDLHVLEREENLGVDAAASEAITWLFDNEETGIILEDDCLANESFFRYCEALLDKYKSTKEVMCITGDNFQNGKQWDDFSYYFSIYNHCWGWATWRRAWRHYIDQNFITEFETFKSEDRIKNITKDSATSRYWMYIFEQISKGKIINWDYKWTFTCWNNGGLTCTPAVNLVSNIGFGDGAQHTIDSQNRLSNLPTKHISFPLKHPQIIEANTDADSHVATFVFQTDRILKQIVHKTLRRLGLLHLSRRAYTVARNSIRKLVNVLR
tara:strand:- start:10551 stop:11561 length:1011 start_codon:yes stop_codon:yes gene_type:complete